MDAKTITTFLTTGTINGIDILFWIWAILVVLAFILLLIPDPVTSAFSIPVFGFTLLLLALLVLRGATTKLIAIWEVVSHPFTIAFIVSLLILNFAKNMQIRRRKKK